MADAQPHDPQTGIADALAQLSEETRVLVRQEMERARSELWDRTKDVAPGALMLALAGGLGLASAASAYRLVLRILERMSTPGVAAFLATAGFGAGAFLALKTAREQLRGAPLPFPVSTVVETAGDVADTVQEAARKAG